MPKNAFIQYVISVYPLVSVDVLCAVDLLELFGESSALGSSETALARGIAGEAGVDMSMSDTLLAKIDKEKRFSFVTVPVNHQLLVSHQFRPYFM